MTDFARLQFKSLASAAKYCEDHKSITGSSSTNNTPSQRWDLKTGYDGALSIMHTGGHWPEGAKSMKKAMVKQAPLVAVANVPQLGRTVAGGAVCVGAYLTGNPNAMYRRQPHKAIQKPILKVGVNIVASSATNASQLVNLGAAWLSVVKELEAQGYRCQLEAFWLGGTASLNSAPTRKKGWIDFSIQLKAPDQAFNPVALAFMIAHPAAFRRIGFKLAETVKDWGPTVNHSYGNSTWTTLTASETAKRYDLFTPTQHGNPETETPEGALRYVQGIVNKQLQEMAAE